jgi:DNA-binding MarR family transcriptional regulator
MKPSRQKIITALLRVINKFSRNESKPRCFGIDELLHPSEIHMVMLIGDNPGTHGAELARVAGITRGAVSQFLAKLEKKGLIEKKSDPQHNLKRVPTLTNKGKVAYYAHEQFHEEKDADLYAYLEQLDEKEAMAISNFLIELEKMADRKG